MNVFVTGATGYIGSVVAEKLQAAGHDVTGLARSDKSAKALAARGVAAVRGDLRDRDVVARTARACDAVIHLAMEFSAEAPQLDRSAIEAILEGLDASGKAFVYTSGIWVMGDTGGRIATEADPVHPIPLVAWRPEHEQMVLRAKGVHGVVIRPAMVYGRGGGFAGEFASQAAKTGVVRVIGTGENRWPFVDVDDLADLYLLALNAPAGSLYFAAAGESIPVAEVAAAAANNARIEFVPVESARKSLGPMADALLLDQLVSGRKAIEELGWTPRHPSVVDELRGARTL